MQKKVKRSSNIELLRIAAMLMIILYHIVFHCVNIQLTDINSIHRMDNGLFNHPLFYKKLIILNTMNTFGIIGNVIFILISGYFMVEKGKDIDLIKISKKLLLQLGYASVVLTIASTICFWMKRGTFFNLVNIQTFNSMSWFVGYYYAVVLIAVLFLNDFLAKLDDRKYIAFLIASFAFIQFGWTGSLADGLTQDLRTLLNGVFLYALGGSLRRYELLCRIRNYVFFLVMAVTYFLVNLSAYNQTQNNIENYIRNNSDGDFLQSIPGFPNYSIAVIIIGVCMFEIFRRIRIPQSKFLNYIGQATFMCYLIHDNSFFYSIWGTQDWITLLYYHPYKFLLKIFVWASAVFVCGVAAYTFYIILTKLFAKYKWIFLRNSSINH